MEELLDEMERILASGSKINIDYHINETIDEDKQEEKLTLAELEDQEIVDDDTFRLVINAQLIARYGLPVLKITAKGGSS